MIPNDTAVLEVEGNLAEQTHEMGIDPEMMAHIISLVTEAYSDDELAVIREYSVNAIDSHAEAGNTAPIEITLPNAMNPYYMVKDEGVGMSPNEIAKYYARYGASSKRTTNIAAGMLGIGCKSALAYTNIFTVIAIKNGVRTEAHVRKNPDGTGAIDIVDTRSTTERNGVTIKIRIKDRNSFNAKAAKFFSFWKPGTVLINGKPANQAKMLEVAPNVYQYGEQGSYWQPAQSYIVMGNIAYPIDDWSNWVDYQYRTFGMVAYVPIGSVDFAPSREALRYNSDRTKATIKKVAKEFQDGLVAAAKKEIVAAPDHKAAYEAWAKWRRQFPNLATSYKGDTLIDMMPLPQDGAIRGRGIKFNSERTRNQAQRTDRLELSEVLVEERLIVTGYTAESLSQTTKAKVKQYVNKHGHSGIVYFVNKMPDSIWFKNAKTIDYATLKAEKLPRNATGVSLHPMGSFMLYRLDGQGSYSQERVTELPDEDIPVIYYSPAEDQFSVSRMAKFVSEPVFVALLGMNRWDKFKRNYSDAMRPNVYAKTVVDKAIAELPDDYTSYKGIDYDTRTVLQYVDTSKIDDPRFEEVKALYSKYKNDTSIEKNYDKALSLGTTMRYHTYGVNAKPCTLLNDYPLISGSGGRRHSEHITLYVNAVYAAKKEEEDEV